MADPGGEGRAGFRGGGGGGGGGNRGGCPGEGAPHGAHNNDFMFFWFIVTRSKLLICVN